MTQPKREPYNVIYSDGTYQTFELAKGDLATLFDALQDGKPVRIESMILVTRDIRTVVPCEAQEPEIEQADSADPPMDAITRQWLSDQNEQEERAIAQRREGKEWQ